MRKTILLFIVVGIFLLSCAPVSQEGLQSQAAAQLQNLSDEELQQLVEQKEQGNAIAGEGYKIPPTANANMRNAVNVLRRINTNERARLINAEVEARTARGSTSTETAHSCETNRDCLPPSTERGFGIGNYSSYCLSDTRLASVRCDSGRCSQSIIDCRTLPQDPTVLPHCAGDGRCVEFRGWNMSWCDSDNQCVSPDGYQGTCSYVLGSAGTVCRP